MKNVKKPSPTKSYGKIRKIQNIILVNLNEVKRIRLVLRQNPRPRPSTATIYFIIIYLLNLIRNHQQRMSQKLHQHQLPTPVPVPRHLNLNVMNLMNLLIIKDSMIIWELIKCVCSWKILQVLIINISFSTNTLIGIYETLIFYLINVYNVFFFVVL